MSSTINRCFKARCPDQISGRMLKFTLQALILQSLSCLTSQQVTSVILLYLVLFVTGIHFLHMFSWLYHYFKLILGIRAKLAIIVILCVICICCINFYSYSAKW